MSLEIKGKVVEHCAMQSGEKNGKQWSSQDFIIETQDQYPKKIAINLYGDKIKDLPSVGEIVSVEVNIGSREHNGRWFTVIGAWKITKEVTELKKNEEVPF